MSAAQEPKPDQFQNLTPIPAPRRVVTGHNPEGKSIVLRDEVQPAQYWTPGSVNAIYDFHRTNEAPARIDSELVTGSFVDTIALDRSHNSPNGSVFRSFEFAPGTITPFHRTQTLDYGVVMNGTITLELDDGVKVKLNHGDVITQRGTAHAWINESNDWVRVYFMLLGAHAPEAGGKQLKEQWNLR